MIGPTIAASPRLHARPRKMGARREGSPPEVSTAAAVHTEESLPPDMNTGREYQRARRV
jgi:hypothetical protein